VQVTTNDSLLIHLLTPMFASFRQQCPDVRLDVVLVNQVLNLSKRDADVAIRATGHPPENLVGRRVARIAWALYGRASDFGEMDVKGPESVIESPWVTLGDNLASLKVVQFVQQHVAPERVVYKVNAVLGLAEAVETGIGIGHLPCFVGDVRPGLVRLSAPQSDFAADLWLLTHPDLRQSARVRVFLDFLAAEKAPLADRGRGTSSRPDPSKLNLRQCKELAPRRLIVALVGCGGTPYGLNHHMTARRALANGDDPCARPWVTRCATAIRRFLNSPQ
jgi:DNA-binding transcriptional LysR family regulator